MEIMRSSLRSSFSCLVRVEQRLVRIRRRTGGFGGGLGDEDVMIDSYGVGNVDVEIREKKCNGRLRWT